MPSEPRGPALAHGAKSSCREIWTRKESECQGYSAGWKISVAWKPTSFLQRKFIWAGDPCGSWDETDAQDEGVHESRVSRKQKSKRLPRDLGRSGLEEFSRDVWLVFAPLPLGQVAPETPQAARLLASLPATRVSEEAAVLAAVCIQVSGPYA